MLDRIRRPHLRWLGRALTAAGLACAGAANAGPYVLIDAESGRVLAQSDAGKPWYPASVTKLMTTYLAFRAMRERKLEPNSLLTVSENAAAQPPSKMGFRPGTEVTLDNAIKMLMVRSANDVAVVVAEGVSGSVEKFVEEMNAAAARLGMTASRFANPHGLPDENQVTSARDMAILGRALIREFPEYELYFRIPAITIGKRFIRNHNRLIDRYPGADGMKTGFICSSGFNVVASARRDGRRLVAVVFGAPSSLQRAEEAARLLERGFARSFSLAGLFEPEAVPINAIDNLAGEPLDLRETLCGAKRKRKRPASESDTDDEVDAVPGRQSLLVDLPPSMPPIRVFVGSPRRAPASELALDDGEPEKPAKKGKGKDRPAVVQAASAGAKLPPRAPMPVPRPAK